MCAVADCTHQNLIQDVVQVVKYYQGRRRVEGRTVFRCKDCHVYVSTERVHKRYVAHEMMTCNHSPRGHTCGLPAKRVKVYAGGAYAFRCAWHQACP